MHLKYKFSQTFFHRQSYCRTEKIIPLILTQDKANKKAVIRPTAAPHSELVSTLEKQSQLLSILHYHLANWFSDLPLVFSRKFESLDNSLESFHYQEAHQSTHLNRKTSMFTLTETPSFFQSFKRFLQNSRGRSRTIDEVIVLGEAESVTHLRPIKYLL